MGEQVPQGYRPLWRAQLRDSSGIESVEHLRRPERGVDIGHRSVQRKLLLLDELQGGHRRDQLDHRGDTKNGITRHGWRFVKPTLPENSLIHDAIVSRRQCHHSGHFGCARCGAEHRVDVGQCAEGGSARCFGARNGRVDRAH